MLRRSWKEVQHQTDRCTPRPSKQILPLCPRHNTQHQIYRCALRKAPCGQIRLSGVALPPASGKSTIKHERHRSTCHLERLNFGKLTGVIIGSYIRLLRFISPIFMQHDTTGKHFFNFLLSKSNFQKRISFNC